jgi:hypothetical protein
MSGHHQTRRAISVKGLTYQQIKSYCDANGKTISGWIEEIVAAKLDDLGIPPETVLKQAARPPRVENSDDFKGGSFTF